MKRVEHRESIVVGDDFEQSQKIAKLVGSVSLAPLAAPVSAKDASPPPATSPPAQAAPASGNERTMTAHASPPPRESWELKPGDVLANRYTIQRLLGRGGMGAVYLASDEVLAEPVALKMIASVAAPWDPTLVERF